MKATLPAIALGILLAALPAHAGSEITKTNLDKLQAASPEMQALMLKAFNWQDMDEEEEEEDTPETEICSFDRAAVRKDLQDRGLLQSMDAVARKHRLEGADHYLFLIHTLTNALVAAPYRAMLASRDLPSGADAEAIFPQLSCVSEADIKAVEQHRQQITEITTQMAVQGMEHLQQGGWEGLEGLEGFPFPQ